MCYLLSSNFSAVSFLFCTFAAEFFFVETLERREEMLKEDKRVKMKVCPKRYQNEEERGKDQFHQPIGAKYKHM